MQPRRDSDLPTLPGWPAKAPELPGSDRALITGFTLTFIALAILGLNAWLVNHHLAQQAPPQSAEQLQRWFIAERDQLRREIVDLLRAERERLKFETREALARSMDDPGSALWQELALINARLVELEVALDGAD